MMIFARIQNDAIATYCNLDHTNETGKHSFYEQFDASFCKFFSRALEQESRKRIEQCVLEFFFLSKKKNHKNFTNIKWLAGCIINHIALVSPIRSYMQGICQRYIDGEFQDVCAYIDARFGNSSWEALLNPSTDSTARNEDMTEVTNKARSAVYEVTSPSVTPHPLEPTDGTGNEDSQVTVAPPQTMESDGIAKSEAAVVTSDDAPTLEGNASASDSAAVPEGIDGAGSTIRTWLNDLRARTSQETRTTPYAPLIALLDALYSAFPQEHPLHGVVTQLLQSMLEANAIMPNGTGVRLNKKLDTASLFQSWAASLHDATNFPPAIVQLVTIRQQLVEALKTYAEKGRTTSDVVENVSNELKTAEQGLTEIQGSLERLRGHLRGLETDQLMHAQALNDSRARVLHLLRDVEEASTNVTNATAAFSKCTTDVTLDPIQAATALAEARTVKDLATDALRTVGEISKVQEMLGAIDDLTLEVQREPVERENVTVHTIEEQLRAYREQQTNIEASKNEIAAAEENCEKQRTTISGLQSRIEAMREEERSEEDHARATQLLTYLDASLNELANNLRGGTIGSTSISVLAEVGRRSNPDHHEVVDPMNALQEIDRNLRRASSDTRERVADILTLVSALLASDHA